MALKLTQADATRRDKAVTTRIVASGNVVLSDLAWCSALLPSEKGQRCDHCHRAKTGSQQLRKCTRCAEYWYCGPECQSAQWNLHHRRICKRFHVYTSSSAFRGLDEYYRTDSVLLSHVMALSPSPASEENMASIRDLNSLSKLPPYRIFMDLLPSGNALTLPVATESDVSSTEVYSRFKNNNFVVHSHLNPGFAHGIFPIASRFLNHSCTPNAAPRFVLSPFNPPRMEIVALRQLASGEEVTIPYVDPATPYRQRMSSLEKNYGFTCRCELCHISHVRWRDEASIPAPPSTPPSLRSFGRAVQLFAFGPPSRLRDDSMLFKELPDALNAVMHPLYLSALAEAFSTSSHDGPLEDALDVGRTLLALYRIIYPANFPMIGLHALEMAKVAWNTICVGAPDARTSGDTPQENEAKLFRLVHEYRELAATILTNFGEEGDEGGPLLELSALSSAINEY